MTEPDAQIDPHLARVFKSELLRQFDFLERGGERLDVAVAGGHSGSIWYEIDAVCSTLGRVASILWPAQDRKGSVLRAKMLRAKLGVSDTSYLTARQVRNGFEHFDERIDEWYRASARRNIVESLIGPRAAISGVQDIEIARHFDPSISSVSVFGEAIDLGRALKEAARIRDLVTGSPCDR